MATSNPDGTRKWRITVLISGSGSNLQALLDALPASHPLHSSQITAVFSSRSDAKGLTRAKSATPSVPAEAFPLLRWRKAREQQGQSATREEWEQDLAQKTRETKPDLVVLAGWMLILSSSFLEALTRDWDEASPSPGTLDPLPPVTSLPSYDPTGSLCSSGLPTPGTSPYSPPLHSTLKGNPIPIINLHPALPGQFPGAHAIKDAWEAFNVPSSSTLLSATQAAAGALEGIADAAPAPAEGEKAAQVAAEQADGAGPRRITKTGIMIHRVIPLLDAGAPVLTRDVSLVEGESLEDLETRIHEVEHEGIVEAVRIITEELLRAGRWWQEA
ncbi:hypothetical protein JCM11641_001678 [Rhodosporidiobolus odoratus]